MSNSDPSPASDKSVPHFNVHTTTYDPLPEFGGSQSVLYTSPDGRRLAGSFREAGTHTMTMPFDEFVYVIAGSCRITVDDGTALEIAEGDCCYLREGMHVTWEMSDDFHDVTVLVSDTPFDIDEESPEQVAGDADEDEQQG